MQIRSLENISLETLISTLLEAFQGYYVPMSAEVAYWEKRFYMASVDYALSYGMFDGDSLVGFIINGVDVVNGQKTAYNTGTGVIPAYRSNRVVDQLYTYVLPVFRENDIQVCTLEVIEQNEKAIRVYERIGFHKTHYLRAFRGALPAAGIAHECVEVPFPAHHDGMDIDNGFYSWDNRNQAVLLGKDVYTCYEVSSSGRPVGYFLLNCKTGAIAQLDIYETMSTEDWDILLAGIAGRTTSVRLVNVDNRRRILIEKLVTLGLENFINQFEMRMELAITKTSYV